MQSEIVHACRRRIAACDDASDPFGALKRGGRPSPNRPDGLRTRLADGAVSANQGQAHSRA